MLRKGILHKALTCIAFVSSFSLTFGQSDSMRKEVGRHLDDVESVAVAPGDAYVATGSWDKTVQIFTGDSNHIPFQVLNGHNAAVSALGFSGTGDVLVTAGLDYKVMIWSKENKSKFELVQELDYVHSAGINSIFVGPYGNMIYSSGYDGKIVVYNRRKGSSRQIDNKLPVNEIALNPTRQFIYCADESPIVKMYDGVGNKIRELKGHKDVVNSVACNNEFIITGSSDRTAIVWDVARGKKKRVLEGHEWKVTSVAISGDGRYAVTGSIDGTTKIWDINSGEELQSYSEDFGVVRNVVMSRNMRYIYTAVHRDSTIHYDWYGASIWNTGLDYKPVMSPEMVRLLQAGGKQNPPRDSHETRNIGTNPSRNTGKKENPKTNIDTNKQVLTNTNEITITIEDE